MEKLNKFSGVIAIVAVLIAIFAWNAKSETFGGGTRFPNGISADSTSPTSGQVRGTTFTATGDMTLGGGTLTVTTANTATSTLIAGCFQFYATSTATAQRYQASTTPGVMYSEYGSCPNL